MELTPTLNSMTPQSTNIVESPSPLWTLSISRYRIIEQTVVNSPSKKIKINPTFLLRLTFSRSNTGIGISATTMSDTIVTTAYPVNDGPGLRHSPSTSGFHDLCT